MDQTEQIIEALKDAGVKAEQVLTDALPVLLAETRALGLAYVIGGCIAAVLGIAACLALGKHAHTLLDHVRDTGDEGGVMFVASAMAAIVAGCLGLAGPIVALCHLPLLFAPTVYLVERLL